MMTTIHIPRSVPWLPPSLREIPGEIRHIVRISEPERKIFRKHRMIPVSRWAERYRHVTLSVLPGKWKNEVTPYLAGIMDASFFPSVQTVIICKGVQVGGTEAVLNCIGYAIDRSPGPVLLVYPDAQTADENFRDRIQPMIRKSPRLRSYLTGVDDDVTINRIGLAHMSIYTAWASSTSRLANKPIRHVVFDEIDKPGYETGKRETSPILLGEARTTTFRHNRKIWKISTPTTETGNIWKALKTEAQVIFDFWVQCPVCKVMQKMTFGQIKWPRKTEPGADGKLHSEDPETIEAENLAWYECPHCLVQWNDYDRDVAARHGVWRERKKQPATSEGKAEDGPGLDLAEYLRRRRPVKIGFHLPSLNSSFVALSKIAATFLRGPSDLNEFKKFHNEYMAEPWKLVVTSKNEEQILAARCDLPAQTVPEEAITLTCGMDRQKYGFWFVVRAWAANFKNWLIHYGFVETEEEMEKILFESAYPVRMGTDLNLSPKTMQIWRAAADTGGGEKDEDMTMTDEMYFWILKNRGRGGVALWGTKGSSRSKPEMLTLGPAFMSTRSGKKLPGALRILSVDTERAKDQFHNRLQWAVDPETRNLPGGPGGAFLHAGTGPDYVAQILAEQKQLDDNSGHEKWVNVHNRPNHLFDAEILAAACTEMSYPGGGLRLLVGGDASRRGDSAAPGGQKTGRRVISKGVK
jgi:phage terminase large subunit GpA-like protein